MKKLSTLLIIILCAVTAGAQDYSKMSPTLRKMVAARTKSGRAQPSVQSVTAGQERVLMFAQGTDSDIERYCIRHQGDVHIVSIPIDEVATLSLSGGVTRLEMERHETRLALDSVASVTGAGKAWAGLDLPQAFQGEGVLVGVPDISQEYIHPAFRSSKDGHLRIVRAWDQTDIPDGQTYDETSTIPFGTFLKDTTDIISKERSKDSHLHIHGTYTASTAAGAGWDTPYRGMAPEADIYLATMIAGDNGNMLPDDLNTRANTTAFQALMFQDIFDYADSIGQPAVISYSMAEFQSMTSGDYLYETYLSNMTGPGRIFVAAAGNAGGVGHCHLPEASEGETIGGVLSTDNYSVRISASAIHAIQIKISDKEHYGEAAYTRTIDLDFLPGDTLRTATGSLTWEGETILTDSGVLDSLYISVICGEEAFDPTRVGYDITLGDGRTALSEGRYIVEIDGAADDSDIYIQEGELLAYSDSTVSLAGALDEGSMSRPASLPSVIGVGATAYRTTFTNLAGTRLRSDCGSGGQRAEFSSKGPSVHGIVKPDVCAPGANIVAAGNSACTTNASYYELLTVAESTLDGSAYPWICTHGTSISTPVVAGAIALWLQADPSLTKDDITDIFQHTCVQKGDTLSYPNNEYGYGEIDAYAGLLYILGLTGIEGISQTHARGCTILPTPEGDISITLPRPLARAAQVRIYSTGGQLLKRVTMPQEATSCTVDAQGVSGVVAVQVDGIGSTLVRL